MEKHWPVDRYVVKADEPFRDVKLLADIAAQVSARPKTENQKAEDQKAKGQEGKKLLDDIRTFIKETSPAGWDSDPAGQAHLVAQVLGTQAVAPNGVPIGALVRNVVEAKVAEEDALAVNVLAKAARDLRWKPARYVVGRGRYVELANQIIDQHPEADRTEIQEFIDKHRNEAKQQSLTTEGVQEAKENISRIGSLDFDIVANQGADEAAFLEAINFFKRVIEKEANGAFKNLQLREDLDKRALSGLPPPQVPPDSKLLEAKGVRGRYSYSWIEADMDFRATHGLSNPRDMKGQPITILDDKTVAKWAKGELPKDDLARRLLGQPPGPASLGAWVASSDAWYKITDKTLDSLKDAKVPDGVVFKLRSSLKDKEFETKEEFTKQLESTLTEDERKQQWYGLVLSYAAALDSRWITAARARVAGEPFSLSSFLFYSREFRSIKPAERDRDKRYEYFVLMRGPEDNDKENEVTGDELQDAWAEAGEVHFSFKPHGADMFHKFTSNNIGQPLGIVLDGKLRSVATIQSAISSQGRITGKGDPDDVNHTVAILKSGALPASLKPNAASENSIGATLARTRLPREHGRSGWRSPPF